MSEAFDMSTSIIPRSDQINAEDLLTGPRIVTITAVKRGNDEQPVNIVTEEFGPGRPYKPSKSMRRILVAAWGSDASVYVGRRLMIYRDPEITFGKDKVGGIRISALSHIDKRLSVALTITRGRRAPFIVEPLPDAPPPPKPITDDQATDFLRDIEDAASLDVLTRVAAELKTVDLGAHKDKLLAAWTNRKQALSEDPTE